MLKKIIISSAIVILILFISAIAIFAKYFDKPIYDDLYLNLYDIYKSETLIGKTYEGGCEILQEIYKSSKVTPWDFSVKEPEWLNENESVINLSKYKNIVAKRKAVYYAGMGTDHSDGVTRGFLITLYLDENMNIVFVNFESDRRGG